MLGSSRLAARRSRATQTGRFPAAFEITSDETLFGRPAMVKLPNSTGAITFRRGFSNYFATATESTGQGTIEFWVYRTGVPPANIVFWDIQEFSTEVAINWRTTGGFSVRCRFGAVTVETAIGAVAVNTWTHVAATLVNNRTIVLWVNGNRISTRGGGTDTLLTSGGSIWRLAAGNTGANPVYMRELRISRTVRYDPADSTYTVPTAPFVSDADTYMLFHMDGTDSGTGGQLFDDAG